MDKTCTGVLLRRDDKEAQEKLRNAYQEMEHIEFIYTYQIKQKIGELLPDFLKEVEKNKESDSNYDGELNPNEEGTPCEFIRKKTLDSIIEKYLHEEKDEIIICALNNIKNIKSDTVRLLRYGCYIDPCDPSRMFATPMLQREYVVMLDLTPEQRKIMELENEISKLKSYVIRCC